MTWHDVKRVKIISGILRFLSRLVPATRFDIERLIMKNTELVTALKAQTVQINTIAKQVEELNNGDVSAEVVTALGENQTAIDALALLTQPAPPPTV